MTAYQMRKILELMQAQAGACIVHAEGEKKNQLRTTYKLILKLKSELRKLEEHD